MPEKSKQWSEEYASIFQDRSVVAAYIHRPIYPPETFSFLASLIPSSAAYRAVLDAGCGTGFIAGHSRGLLIISMQLIFPKL